MTDSSPISNPIQRPIAETTELEAAVMCTLMGAPELLPSVATRLEPQDVQSPLWRKIYKAILEINAVGAEPNFVNVYDYLGDIEFTKLADANDSILTGPAVLEAAVPMIKKYSQLREAQRVMIDAVSSLNAHPAVDIASQWEYLSGDFLKLLRDDNGVTTVADQLVTTLKRIEKTDDTEFIKIGLRGIDATTGGAQRGDVWVIAGRPSIGKSSLAANIFLSMGRVGYVVCYVIAEGTRHSLMCRLLAIFAGIDLKLIRSGQLVGKDYTKITYAAGLLHGFKLFFIEETKWGKIRAHLQALKLRETELAAVFIDYIGLIEVSRNYREREREVAFLSADIKRLAKDLNIVCFPLVQLNREVEKRKDHRPILSDLRESGAIEQDADVVLFPYRPGYYGEKVAFPTDAEVAIAKNREGATGVAEVSFLPECVRFAERDA